MDNNIFKDYGLEVGRKITIDKNKISNDYYEDYIKYNANIYIIDDDNKVKKIWHGDLDLNDIDEDHLMRISKRLDKKLYLLDEWADKIKKGEPEELYFKADWTSFDRNYIIETIYGEVKLIKVNSDFAMSFQNGLYNWDVVPEYYTSNTFMNFFKDLFPFLR